MALGEAPEVAEALEAAPDPSLQSAGAAVADSKPVTTGGEAVSQTGQRL